MAYRDSYPGNMNLDASRWNIGARNAAHFAQLRLPNLLMRWPAGKDRGALTYRGVQKWQRLARRLAEIEASLTTWEAEHPEVYKELPWFDAREEFKRSGGTTPTWWELAGASDQVSMIMRRTFRDK